MIKKYFVPMVLFITLFSIGSVHAASETEVDWCSIGDWGSLSDGEEIEYLSLLGLTAIPHIRFTEQEIEAAVNAANVDVEVPSIYIRTLGAEKYLYIVDPDVVRFPRSIKLSTFVQELDETKTHYLQVLGVPGTPNPEEFPYTQEMVEALVKQQKDQGSDDVYITSALEKVTVNGVEQQVSVDYIYIVDELYDEPVGMLLASVIDNMNSVEESLNKYGMSIREDGNFSDGDEQGDDGDTKGVDLYAIFNDPDKLEEQALEAIRLEVAVRANECIAQVYPKNCPILKMEDVLAIPGVDSDTKINMPDGPNVSLDEFVLAVNTSALAACALGHVILTGAEYIPEFDVSAGDGEGITWARFSNPFSSLDTFVSNIFSSIDLSMIELNLGDSDIDSFLSPLLLKFESSFGSFDDIKLQFEGYAISVQNYFSDLIGFNSEGGEEGGWEMPDIPNIFKYNGVEPPAPPPLKITKSYDWVGLDVGSDSTISAKVEAHAEMRAGENSINSEDSTHAFAHYALAKGSAEMHVFGKKASLASAWAAAYAGLDQVSAEMEAQIFGYNWVDVDLTENENGGKLLKIIDTYPFSDSHSETLFSQIFMLGPIPLRVHAGAFVRSGLNAEYGLVSLKVYAQARPFVAAGLTASATLDIIIASAGVRASLTIIDVGIPITAQAALKHSSKNGPYIDMDLNGDATYSVLDGQFMAYVKYYVPRAGIPPWKKKKINKVLFDWTGMEASQSIFSWGATLGSGGMELRGNPLTMGLADAYDGQSPLVAVISYQGDTDNRIKNSLESISSHLEFAPDIVQMSELGLTDREQLTADITRYDAELVQIFNNEDPQQIDTDSDGVIDIIEEELGTNPNEKDSDFDGLLDDYEISQSHLDPNDPNDALLDSDGDGFNNLEEFAASSDPLNPNITPDNIAAIIMIPVMALLLH